MINHALFILLIVIAFSSYAADSCQDDRNRQSYDYVDPVCAVKAVLGYTETDSMNIDAYNGFFRPVIKIRPGTAWKAFGSMSCTHVAGPTELDYLAMGGTGIEGDWVFRYVAPAGVCLRLEVVRTEPHASSDMGNCWNSMANMNGVNEQQNYLNAVGKWGADYPGQMALCAYTTSWLTDDRYCDDMANTKIIKCIKIPPAPPPPPFCDMIMSSQRVRAVYLKPDPAIGLNSYFAPATRLIVSTTKKTCDDGTVQDPNTPCADGSEGEYNSSSITNSVAADLSTGTAYGQQHEVSLGSTRYWVWLTVRPDEMCVEGSYESTGSREFLGCFPRNAPAIPELQVFGSLGATPAEDALYLRALFFGVPSTPSYAEMMPVSAEQIATAIDEGRVDDVQTDFFDMTMSAMRTAFKPLEDSPEELLPKKICTASDGTHMVGEATEKCDDTTAITTVTRYLCNDGDNVEQPSECGEDGGGTPITMKQCGDTVFVGLESPCDVGLIVYDDDTSGDQICMQGLKLEEEVFFILREDAQGNETKKFFKKNPILLIPVIITDGRMTDDYSKSTIDINSLSQSTLDTMTYSMTGYYTITIDSAPQNYRFGVRVDIDASGNQTIYSDVDTGSPFFVPQEESEFILPADPLMNNLCIEIPTENMPLKKTFTVAYNHPGIYSGDTWGTVGTVDHAGACRNSHFDTALVFGNSEVPGCNIADNYYYRIEDFPTSRDLTPYPVSYGNQLDSSTWYHNVRGFTEDAILAGAPRGPTNENSYSGYASHYLIEASLKQYYTYFLDSRIEATGCSALEFELWGGGSAGRATKVGNITNAWTFDFSHNNGERHWRCSGYGTDYGGSVGESGAYVKGKMNLRRGSKIVVILGSDTGENVDNGTRHSPGTSLWIAEEGGPYKMIALAKSGDPYMPRNINLSDESSYTMPHENEKFINAIDSSLFGTSNYGELDWEKNVAGVYERPGIEFDRTRATLKEYKNVQGGTFCGRNLESENLFDRGAISGPITLVDGSGHEKIIDINPDLSLNDRNTDVNLIGTWPIYRRAHHLKGWARCEHVAEVTKMWEDSGNVQSKECLRYAMKVLCRNGYEVSGDPNDNRMVRIPSERCKGMGGAFWAKNAGLIKAGWMFALGNFGYAKIVCS